LVRVLVAVLVLLVLAGMVVRTVLTYRARMMKGNVLVTAVPERQVVLTLAGQRIRNGEIVELAPGDYDLVVSAPGYVAHRESLHVRAGRTASRVEVVLTREGGAPEPGGKLAPLWGPDAGVLEQTKAPTPR
jgi:hypothetical protein